MDPMETAAFPSFGSPAEVPLGKFLFPVLFEL